MTRAAYTVLFALVLFAGIAFAGDFKVKQREPRVFAPDGWTNSMRWNYFFQFPAGISTTNLLDASAQGWNAYVGPSTNGWLFSNNCAVATGTTSYVMADYGDGGVGPWVGVTSFTVCGWWAPQSAAVPTWFQKGRSANATNRCVRVTLNALRPQLVTANWTGASNIQTLGPTAMTLGEWYLMSASYDAGTKAVIICTNAVVCATNFMIAPMVLADSNGIGRLMLGNAWENGARNGIGARFGQSILFDRALSGAEITNLFEATKTRYGYPP
jgi:hypothetical protein